MREMTRVLRPGGRLVVGELGRWNLWAAKRRMSGWPGSSIWRSAAFRTVRALKDLATDAGHAITGAWSGLLSSLRTIGDPARAAMLGSGNTMAGAAFLIVVG
jgi:hypothetical protein